MDHSKYTPVVSPISTPLGVKSDSIPFYKNWKFWLVIFIILVIIISVSVWYFKYYKKSETKTTPTYFRYDGLDILRNVVNDSLNKENKDFMEYIRVNSQPNEFNKISELIKEKPNLKKMFTMKVNFMQSLEKNASIPECIIKNPNPNPNLLDDYLRLKSYNKEKNEFDDNFFGLYKFKKFLENQFNDIEKFIGNFNSTTPEKISLWEKNFGTKSWSKIDDIILPTYDEQTDMIKIYYYSKLYIGLYGDRDKLKDLPNDGNNLFIKNIKFGKDENGYGYVTFKLNNILNYNGDYNNTEKKLIKDYVINKVDTDPCKNEVVISGTGIAATVDTNITGAEVVGPTDISVAV